MAEAEVKKVLALVPELLEVPYPRIWTSYDKEADYTSISRSQAMQMIPSSRMMTL